MADIRTSTLDTNFNLTVINKAKLNMEIEDIYN